MGVLRIFLPIFVFIVGVLPISLFSTKAFSLTFALPEEGNMVGELQTITPQPGKKTLGALGRDYGIGLKEIAAANPNNDLWQVQTSDRIIIPALFVLPSGPRQGIVINLSEMRLYYYHPNGKTVDTYPIAIGREGWQTPTTSGVVVNKEENPTWYVPQSILEESIRNHHPLPPTVPPGPNNPLGKYALKLSIPNILIHGTQSAHSIGQRSSHGCIRLLDNDIETLFDTVSINTPVRMVHEPFKVGFKDKKIYLEAHEPLSDHMANTQSLLLDIAKKVADHNPNGHYHLEWTHSENLAREATGVPTVIGVENQ